MTRQPLAIGSTVAMEDRLSLVIRTLKGGVALRFLEPFSRHDLGERVARRMIEPAVTSPGQTGWSRDGGLRA